MNVLTTGSRSVDVDTAAGTKIGDIATAVATQHTIGGSTFTLKANGQPLDPDTAYDPTTHLAPFELIEHVDHIEPTHATPIADDEPVNTITVGKPAGKLQRTSTTTTDTPPTVD